MAWFFLYPKDCLELVFVCFLKVEEESLAQSGGLGNMTSFPRRQVPPTLPPPPPNLTPQQLKRRHIVAAIVHSENSYVATLQRLVNVSFFPNCFLLTN